MEPSLQSSRVPIRVPGALRTEAGFEVEFWVIAVCLVSLLGITISSIRVRGAAVAGHGSAVGCESALERITPAAGVKFQAKDGNWSVAPTPLRTKSSMPRERGVFVNASSALADSNASRMDQPNPSAR